MPTPGGLIGAKNNRLIHPRTPTHIQIMYYNLACIVVVSIIQRHHFEYFSFPSRCSIDQKGSSAGGYNHMQERASFFSFLDI